jgi:hypothetical protein
MIARTSRAAPEPERLVDRAATVAVAVPGVLMAEALGRVLCEAGMHVVGCYEEVRPDQVTVRPDQVTG